MAEVTEQQEYNFLDTFYRILFHPISLFNAVSDQPEVNNRLYMYAWATVIATSALNPIPRIILEADEITSLSYQIPIQMIMGVVVWLFLASIISMLSYIFTEQSRLKCFLTLTGFAYLPWMFTGIVTFLQVDAGGLTNVTAVVGSMLIWFWTFLLFGLAVSTTFRLPMERTVLLLVSPFLMTLVFTAWTSGFLTNLAHFFN